MRNISIIIGLSLLITSPLFAQSLPRVVSPEEIAFTKTLQYFLVKDGKERSIKGGRASPIIYSPDGKSYVYKTTDEKGVNTLIKDGKEIGKYGEIQEIKYSPDGKSFAYMAQENDKYFLIKDGKKTVIPSMMGTHGYSVDNKHGQILKDNGKYILVEDGIVKDQDFISYEDIINSPNAKKYNFKKSNVGNIQKLGESGESSENKIIYSPNGKSSAYIEKENGKQFLIKDGKKSKGYNIIHRFFYSPDGNSFIYSAFDKQGSVLSVDGVESEFAIQDAFYSPNGSSYGYIISHDFGKKILIIDGKKIGEYDDILWPQYSSDGKRFAFVARRGQSSLLYTKYVAVIDGIESQEYSHIGEIIFSPDGVGYSYFADKPGNNKLSPNYSLIFSLLGGFVICIVSLLYFYIKKYRLSKDSTQ